MQQKGRRTERSAALLHSYARALEWFVVPALAGYSGFSRLKPVLRTRVLFRGGEEDEKRKFLRDGVKMVFLTGRYKKNGPGLNGARFFSRLKRATSFYNVINLVLTMRSLRINRSGPEHVQTTAESRHAQEFQVGLLRLLLSCQQIGQREVSHGH